jgi:hypothetical protein
MIKVSPVESAGVSIPPPLVYAGFLGLAYLLDARWRWPIHRHAGRRPTLRTMEKFGENRMWASSIIRPCDHAVVHDCTFISQTQ